VTRAVLLPAAVLAVVYGAGTGFLVGGPTTASATPALAALLVASAAAGLGWGAARLVSRDARKSWALSPLPAQILMGLLVAVAIIAQPPFAFAAAFPIAAGYAWGRGGRHASDVACLGAGALVGFAVLFHPGEWDASAAWLLPCLLVALALAARETWDLLDARADARAQALAFESGALPEESGAERVELARAIAILGGAVLVAALIGFAHDSLRDLTSVMGPGFAFVVLVGAIWGVIALLKPRKERAS
jgi:hypothetical protein